MGRPGKAQRHKCTEGEEESLKRGGSKKTRDDRYFFQLPGASLSLFRFPLFSFAAFLYPFYHSDPH